MSVMAAMWSESNPCRNPSIAADSRASRRLTGSIKEIPRREIRQPAQSHTKLDCRLAHSRPETGPPANLSLGELAACEARLDQSVHAVAAREYRPANDRSGNPDAEKAQTATAASADPGSTPPRLLSRPHPPWLAVRREMKSRRIPRPH